MKFIKNMAFLIVVCASLSASAQEVNEQTKRLIDELLMQTGQSALAVGKQFSDVFVQQMTSILKSSNPNIEPRAFTIMEEEINLLIEQEFVNANTLAKMMYPIYARHFTDEDLRGLIAFNKTPLGQKAMRVMPEITQAGMQAGQQLGIALGPKISQRIKGRLAEEGIELQGF